MEIAIFNAITTEEALSKLEAEAKKYDGLYCDMDDKKERKYVKDNAALIAGLVKKLDRARIDIAKDHKAKVEGEAKAILKRLEAANLPFQSLIDEHKAKRAKEIAEEKARVKAIEDATQLEIDHENAINENKVFDFEKKEREEAAKLEAEKLKAEQAEREKKAAEQAKLQAERAAAKAIENANAEKAQAEQAAKDAEAKRIKDAEQAELKRATEAKAAEEKRLADIEQARLDEIARQEAEQQRIKDDEADRLANREHISAIRAAVKNALISIGLSEELAKKAVLAISNNKVPHTAINY